MSEEWKEMAYDLWGEQWKSTLAKMLLMNRRTVQRWANPNHPIEPPRDVKEKIIKTYHLWVNE